MEQLREQVRGDVDFTADQQVILETPSKEVELPENEQIQEKSDQDLNDHQKAEARSEQSSLKEDSVSRGSSAQEEEE